MENRISADASSVIKDVLKNRKILRKILGKVWRDTKHVEFSGVYDTIDWESEALGVFWHKNCKWSFLNQRRLRKAAEDLIAKENDSDYEKELENDLTVEKVVEFRPRPTRKNFGKIHNEDAFIFCGKGRVN